MAGWGPGGALKSASAQGGETRCTCIEGWWWEGSGWAGSRRHWARVGAGQSGAGWLHGLCLQMSVYPTLLQIELTWVCSLDDYKASLPFAKYFEVLSRDEGAIAKYE